PLRFRLFFFQAEDGIRDFHVTGVQTCALPILMPNHPKSHIVMICTGTGSAPMRAMTEWRRRLRKTGKFESGKLMLFFGARTQEEIGRASCRERGQDAVAAGSVETDRRGRRAVE